VTEGLDPVMSAQQLLLAAIILCAGGFLLAGFFELPFRWRVVAGVLVFVAFLVVVVLTSGEGT